MKHGYVYRIYNLDLDICYFGSAVRRKQKYTVESGEEKTCLHSTNARWHQHKRDYKEWMEGKKRKTTCMNNYFKKYGIDAFTYEILHEIEYENIKELRILEQAYIEAFKCVNEQSAFRIKARLKTYQSQQDVCDLCGKKMRKWNIQRHKKKSCPKRH